MINTYEGKINIKIKVCLLQGKEKKDRGGFSVVKFCYNNSHHVGIEKVS